MKYAHLFFDLDKTLWDFTRNSEETLVDLYNNHGLKQRGIDDVGKFIEVYTDINEKQWADYRVGKMTKEKMRDERFVKTLSVFQVEDFPLAATLSKEYLDICPRKNHMFPNATEVLNYLSRKYTMHIITNGFEEVQHLKMKNCGIDHYFMEVITSEKAGFLKPNPQIFHYAMSLTSSTEDNSIMIGDSLEVDIRGARDAGMDQIFFNPEKEHHGDTITFEISRLSELMEIL